MSETKFAVLESHILGLSTYHVIEHKHVGHYERVGMRCVTDKPVDKEQAEALTKLLGAENGDR
jgi:hypothetical protein